MARNLFSSCSSPFVARNLFPNCSPPFFQYHRTLTYIYGVRLTFSILIFFLSIPGFIKDSYPEYKSSNANSVYLLSFWGGSTLHLLSTALELRTFSKAAFKPAILGWVAGFWMLAWLGFLGLALLCTVMTSSYIIDAAERSYDPPLNNYRVGFFGPAMVVATCGPL